MSRISLPSKNGGGVEVEFFWKELVVDISTPSPSFFLFMLLLEHTTLNNPGGNWDFL